jgi:hypothetical protein
MVVPGQLWIDHGSIKPTFTDDKIGALILLFHLKKFSPILFLEDRAEFFLAFRVGTVPVGRNSGGPGVKRDKIVLI